MNWWQSLLIATIPAIFTGIVSFLVANQQVKVAKKELEEKYIKENELYVSKTRFDKEFSIYQELLEKFVSMVIDCGNLFPVVLVRRPNNENELLKLNRAIYEKIGKSYFDAHVAVYKYAAFIPNKIFVKFKEIIDLCGIQKRYFAEKNLLYASIESNEITECYKRTNEINDKTELLISELRAYLSSINEKEKTNG